MGTVNVDVEFADIISFAAAYNKRPLIRALSISSSTGETYNDVEVSVELRSVDVTLAEPWRMAGLRIGPIPTSWTSSDFSTFEARRERHARRHRRQVRRARHPRKQWWDRTPFRSPRHHHPGS